MHTFFTNEVTHKFRSIRMRQNRTESKIGYIISNQKKVLKQKDLFLIDRFKSDIPNFIT